MMPTGLVQPSVTNLGTLSAGRQRPFKPTEKLTIWERKDWPSIIGKSEPDMSRMVGARSMFNTGAYGIGGLKSTQIEPLKGPSTFFNTIRVAGTFTICLGAMPGPRTMRGTRMSNSYSCLLSMGRENWPVMTKANAYRANKNKSIRYSTRVRHSFFLIGWECFRPYLPAWCWRINSPLKPAWKPLSEA